MNLIPSLAAGMFAVAGLACAAGPILIHLLNRRRHRTVHWAAMDFLRQALQRNRRMLEMRDIAILALRTLAVLLFGLALAQPFVDKSSILMWSMVFPAIFVGVLLFICTASMWRSPGLRFLTFLGGAAAFAFAAYVFTSKLGVEDTAKKPFDGSQPLHAVVVVDNSMSMGYDLTGEKILDRAKTKAREFIKQLPVGSQVSIIPLCGSQHEISPIVSKEDAAALLDEIETVDRSTNVLAAVNAAKRAGELETKLEKRIVFISDQQIANWRGMSKPEQFNDLPEMQVVDVAPTDWENAWISDFHIEDGLADVETPSTFVVEVQYRGQAEFKDLQVTLKVGDQEVGSKSVRLTSGLGAREVRFEHVFNTWQVEPGKPAAVPVTAMITGDRLSLDDERHLVVHVVSELPVLFVDQFGSQDEDPRKNRLGETKPLRKWLAPQLSGLDRARQLVKIRHRTIEQLTMKELEDARLVVIAGVTSPTPEAVRLLREYVKQGGQLLIAAGGEFDPQRWNDVAWLDGEGILPAPLFPESIGQLPEEASGELNPKFLSYESLGSNYYFRLADTTEEDLRALYSVDLMFFKYVDVNAGDEVKKSLKEAEVKRLTEERAFLDDLEKRQAEQNGKAADPKNPTNGDPALVNDDEQRLREIQPTWLRWKSDTAGPLDETLPEDADERKRRIEELAGDGLPRVLAQFADDKGSPYLVERRVGKGYVLFASSGLQSSWCTIRVTDAMLIFDRICRSMIQSTLPTLNFIPKERIDLPPPSDRNVTLALWRPGQERPERLRIDPTGMPIENPLQRGHYRVVAYRPEVNLDEIDDETPLWQTSLSINGDSAESELAPLTQPAFDKRAAGATKVRWVTPTGEISLAGSQVRNQDMWKFFILAVLVFLLTELALLAWPALKRGRTATASGSE